MKYSVNIDEIDGFDVIVVGGGASGVAAAISAAEQGARTLIIERAGAVGGNLTVGHVGPLMGEYGKNTMSDRINKAFTDNVRRVQNFEEAKMILTRMLDESGVAVYLNSSLADVVTEGDRITHAVITTQNGLRAVSGRVFIDGTGDGLLAYLAGEEYEMGREDGLVQPASIMFTIKGVDPAQTLICRHERMDTQIKKGSYLELCRRACAAGELPPAVNIVRLYPCGTPDERMVNATQVNGLDPLSLTDYTAAQVELRRQMMQVLDFLKRNVEGFENVSVKDSSDVVGFRESRRIRGLYTITAEDVIEGRLHEDVIVHGAAFPIDIHNPAGAGQAESDTTPHASGKYDIPYRATVPTKNKNLLLSGRCISGTHRAHASYRVMNTVINIGEAVGIAAAICAAESVAVQTLDAKRVQSVLSERGVDLFCEV